MDLLSQHEAFLRAIFDAPDDDTPRLVYADFLQENGEEDRADVALLHLRSGRGARVRNQERGGRASEYEGNGEEQARGDGPGRQPRRAARRHRTGREHTHLAARLPVER